ncbi:MAG: 50S ribosomal protein L9 [Pelagibacterales bacterium]|nr:50S ribosomal protein L9 [Pelagibacterales bacterium]
MKIILTAAVANLGRIGDVVEVKNGYAKNFLIPNNKAICFTVSNSKVFESKRKEFEQANQKDLESANLVKEKIYGKDIIIIENASDDGRLYGSVSSATIASEINEVIKQKSVSRADVILAKPIKEIGVYEVKLALHSEASISVRLVVSRSDSEVAALIKAADKKSEKFSQKAEGEEEVKTEVEASEKPKKAKKKKAE